MASKGKFKPRNPAKYKGDIHNIIYRSGWELIYMRRLDRSSSVLEWSSEPFPIPYYSELDKKRHNYWVDFWVRRQDKFGNIQDFLIEIKPAKETKPPRKYKSKAKTLRLEMKRKYRQQKAWDTYYINKSKWEAAEQFCKDNGLVFEILTEKELGLDRRLGKMGKRRKVLK